MAFDDLDVKDQDRIINAACEVFARHGYRKASMRDIAEAAKTSKSVLFKYFSTKENLYRVVFRLAADSIAEADAAAGAAAGEDAGIFALMRASTQERMRLFAEHPWFYRFSYSATFDADPFVQGLVRQEYADYRAKGSDDGHAGLSRYQGLREGLSPDETRRLVLWVSQGYLEERLQSGDTDPDSLRSGFERWIDVLELLLEGRQGETAKRE
jgi:AcrR family transcriptional regulator